MAAAAAGVGLALAPDARADIIQISSAQNFNAGQLWADYQGSGTNTVHFANGAVLETGTLIQTSKFFGAVTWALARAFASLSGRFVEDVGGAFHYGFTGLEVRGLLPAGFPVSHAAFGNSLQLGFALASQTYWTLVGGGSGQHYVLVGGWGSGTYLKSSGYVGFKNPTTGELGWAKVDVDARASFRWWPYVPYNRVDVAGTIGPIYEGSCSGQPLLTGETSCAPPVPEPSSITLLALGAVGMMALRRKRRAHGESALPSATER